MSAEQARGMVSRVWRALLAAAPVKIWAQIGAAMAGTLVLLGFGLVIWLGPWLPEHQALQIEWLGRGLVIAGILTLVALVAITGLSVNVHGGRDGIHASIDQDEPQPLEVKTTVATTVTPAASALPADTGELPESEKLPR